MRACASARLALRRAAPAGAFRRGPPARRPLPPAPAGARGARAVGRAAEGGGPGPSAGTVVPEPDYKLSVAVLGLAGLSFLVSERRPPGSVIRGEVDGLAGRGHPDAVRD